MKAKWILTILLVGLFFNISKADNNVYCKEIGNNNLWGDYIYNITIHYDGIHSYRLAGERVKDYDFLKEINPLFIEKIKEIIEAKKKDLLESGECRFWDE